MSNHPNRDEQRAARALVKSKGVPYQTALQMVRDVFNAVNRADQEPPTHESPVLHRRSGLLVQDPYNPPAGVIPFGMHVSADGTGEPLQALGLRVSELNRHMLISGRTGTGKSEMLKWLIHGAVKAGYPVLLLDPHGGLADDIVDMVIEHCPERAGDVVHVDLGSEEPVTINPLDVRNHHQIYGAVSSVMEMLQGSLRQRPGNAPRAANYVVTALSALAEANLYLNDPETRVNLLHLPRFFRDDEFRRLIMAFCTNEASLEMYDPETGPYETMALRHRSGEILPYIRGITGLANSEAWSRIYGSPENRFDLTKMILTNKIILVKFPYGSFHRVFSDLTGSLILSMLGWSMDEWGTSKDQLTGKTTGRGCRVFIDEASNLLHGASSVPSLLAEARKWDLGITVSTQSIQQFDEKVMQALVANTASRVALSQNPSDAGFLVKALAGRSGKITEEDLTELPDYHMYANLLFPTPGDGVATSGVFSARNLPPINGELNAEQTRLRDKTLSESREYLASGPRQDQEEMAQRIKEQLQEKLLHRLQQQESGDHQWLPLDDSDDTSWTGWSDSDPKKDSGDDDETEFTGW